MFHRLKSLFKQNVHDTASIDHDAAFVVHARCFALTLLHLGRVSQPQAYVALTALEDLCPGVTVPDLASRFVKQIRLLDKLDIPVDRLANFLGEKANAANIPVEQRLELLSDCLILVILSHEEIPGVGALIGSFRRGLGITDAHATSKQLLEYAETFSVIKGLWGTDEHGAAREAIELAMGETNFHFH